MANFQTNLIAELKERGLSASSDNRSDPGSPIEEIIEEKGWSIRRDNIAARLSEMDLHDVERLTTLPRALLEDLSWSQGETKTFSAKAITAVGL
jgi:hypothetical protein